MGGWGTAGRWQVLKAPSWEPAMKTDKEQENVFVYKPWELQGLPDEKEDSRKAETQAPMQQLSPWPRPHLSHWAVAHTQSPLAMMCPSELRHRNSHPSGSPFPRVSSSLTTDSALHATVQRELPEEQAASPPTLAAHGHLAKATLSCTSPW